MQKRYLDSGTPYTWEAWCALHANMAYPGVYSGLDLSPASTGDLQLAAGSFLIPVGILVVETASFTLPIAGFPPALATDYTVYSRYQPVALGLTGGGPVTYGITASLLSSPPYPDSIILGWIRHPGGGIPLYTSMVTSAPKLNPWNLLRLAIDQRPIRLTPPQFQVTLGTGTNHTITYVDPYVEAKFSSPLGTPVTTATLARIAFPVLNGAVPYKVRVKSALPAPLAVQATVRDSLGTSVITDTILSHTGYEWFEILVPPTGVWTDTGVVEFEFTLLAGLSFEVPDIEINFWPYAQVP
jgi:hypothetical protein